MTKRKSSVDNRAKLLAAVTALRADAKAKGLDKLTTRQINEIVGEARRAKDPLSGRTKRLSVTLSERMYRQAKAAAESTGWDVGMLVRQAVGDFLEQLKHPRAPKNTLFDEPDRRRITKAIAESTAQFKTGRYEP